MKKIALTLGILIFFIPAFPQKDLSVVYAETITSDDLNEYLSILASDALEGRETGEVGQKMATAYIEYFFKKNNLEPIINTPSGFSFLQSFDLVKIKPATGWIKVGEKVRRNTSDSWIGCRMRRARIRYHDHAQVRRPKRTQRFAMSPTRHMYLLLKGVIN